MFKMITTNIFAGTVPIVVVGNNNKSDIIVTPSTPGDVHFGIVFTSIHELDMNGSIQNNNI